MVATDMWLSGSLCGRENRVLALFDFKLLCRIRWWEFVPWSVLLKDKHYKTALVPTGADLCLGSCEYLEARSLLWFVGEGVPPRVRVWWDLKGDRSVWRGAYCNGLLTGLPKKSIKQLQTFQKRLVSALTRSREWLRFQTHPPRRAFLKICSFGLCAFSENAGFVRLHARPN